jgi:hypothetical protein
MNFSWPFFRERPRGFGAFWEHVQSVEGARAVGSERPGERGGSAIGREHGGEVESEVREVGSVWGSTVPGRSRSERSSGSGPGGGGFDNQC